MKMTTMWSVSINNMIENKVCRHLTIGFKGRHYLFPLRKVVTNENDIIVISRHWVACHEINPPLGEGPYHDDGKKSRV